MERKIDAEPLSLFRSEALKARASRLDGEVVVAIRSPWLLLGAVATALVALLATTALATRVDRKQKVTGVIAARTPHVPDSAPGGAIMIPVDAVGRIRRGQLVFLSLDAFPSRGHGYWRGGVESVSLVPLTNYLPPSPGASPIVYPGMVTITKPYIDVDGTRIPLQPGMTFTAEIFIGSYSLLQWMFDTERK